MPELNGICYPDKPIKEIKVTKIEVERDYLLKIVFNSGELKYFDFSSLLSTPVFAPLKDKTLFNSVSLEFGIPIWNNGEIDISPAYLYNQGKQKK
jgi:hypothetical protein